MSNLVDLGIVTGYPDGTYKPDDTLTRAAIAKVVVLMLGYKDLVNSSAGPTPFGDVGAGHWASGYVNVASEKGLVKGANGSFRPDDRISFGEAVTILLRSLGYGPSIESSGTWPDNYIAKARELNILQGVSFNSQLDKATRGTFAKLAWNTLNTLSYQSDKTLLKDKFPTYGSQGSSQVHFLDVDGTQYQTAVSNLVNLGIVTGYPDGTYKPDDTLTRAAIAKVVVLMLGYKDLVNSSAGPTPFGDVGAEHWSSGYVNVASEKGLVKGANGSFRPDDRISYGEAVTILLRSLGYGPSIESSGTWPDNYIAKARELNILQGVSFNSQLDKATRGTFAKLAWNTLNTLSYQSDKTLLKDKFPTYGSQGSLQVHFLDVGQADSILVKTPDNKTMLIDAGNGPDADNIINYIKQLGITKLDYVVATHPHEDHIGGMADVINAFDVDQIYMSNGSTTTQAFIDLLQTIQDKGLTVQTGKGRICNNRK